jgi:basic membrane protein A
MGRRTSGRTRATLAAVSLIAAAAVLLAACGGSASPSPSSAKTLVVGGIHLGSVHDAGYNEAQDDGLVYLKTHVPGIKLTEAANIPEAPEVETVMQDMINRGAKLIFPQSFGYQDFALTVAAKNPDVKFEHPAGFKSAANFGTYWAQSTPISYALGAAAAMVSKTGKIGFVGSIPIPGILATVDATELGARSVNPHIKMFVSFNGSFSDPAKEAADVDTFANEGVDVVAGLVDSPITYVKTAESRHIFVIGYHSAAAAAYAPNYWLSGVDFNWGPLFVQWAKQVMAGTWKPTHIIAPVSEDIARLAPFGPHVSAAAKQKAENIVHLFATGKLTSVFRGPVYDQSGKLRVKPGVVPPPIFDQNEVNFLVEGVIGRI